MNYLNAKAQGLKKSKDKVAVTPKSKQDAAAATEFKKVSMEAQADIDQLVGSLKIDGRPTTKVDTPDPTKGYNSIKPPRTITRKKSLD
jgi:hypothetical protein